MQNLLEDLTKLLSKEEKYTSEGRILKNVIIEDALKLDTLLIKLLLSDKKIKKHFFQDIEGIYVFDKIKFQKFISNKQFLPDSYTAFKNKIGLTTADEYITEKKDVVLSWPYKDCVLEGGQDKEDAKRDEIFWNETLAPDEIDRLLSPKVLTNWKKFDKDGDHKVEEVSEKDNLIIKGNNLLGLSSILKKYRGKVKLIYIDPPYNTGNDEFKYNDNFNHSSWITFMKNRLLLARELLTTDGSIYVQLDNNEIHYAKVLMDEIFGINNFQREIIWHLSGAAGYKSLINNYIRGHDTILFYSKSNNFYFNKEYLPYNAEQLKRFTKTDKDGRRYKPITKERRIYLDEAKGVPVSDVWTDIASFQTIVNSPEVTGFSTQKPEKLMKRIISASSTEGDIVLDFNLGSGTTASVAIKMKRKFIGIEQMYYIDEITIPRLQKVIKGDDSGVSKDVNWQGGGSFIYCELAKANQEYIDKINETKDAKSLLKIWKNMQDKAFISYKVDIKSINENVADFKELPLEDQKRFLIETLDKNMLYVPYSEIDDADYSISDEDKKLNHIFYGGKA